MVPSGRHVDKVLISTWGMPWRAYSEGEKYREYSWEEKEYVYPVNGQSSPEV